MLTALLNCPTTAGRSLTWAERFSSMAIILSLFLFDYIAVQIITTILIDQWHFTYAGMWASFGVMTIVITVVLYVYSVYIINLGKVKMEKHN
jgi:hypothetical protein